MCASISRTQGELHPRLQPADCRGTDGRVDWLHLVILADRYFPLT